MHSNQKTFAPTIPTGRRIKKESTDFESPAANCKPSPQKSPRGKKKSHDKKKGRREKNVITSSSVFSMGPSDQRRGIKSFSCFVVYQACVDHVIDMFFWHIMLSLSGIIIYIILVT